MSRSSVTSRSWRRSRTISSASTEVTPGLSPASIPDWRTQRRTADSARSYSLHTVATDLSGN